MCNYPTLLYPKFLVLDIADLTQSLKKSKQNNILLNFMQTVISRGNSVPLSNQTEFIYTVFVGQKPVLAVTAADDMKLVSQQEMVKVMENDVFTKAERKFVC